MKKNPNSYYTWMFWAVDPLHLSVVWRNPIQLLFRGNIIVRNKGRFPSKYELTNIRSYPESDDDYDEVTFDIESYSVWNFQVYWHGSLKSRLFWLKSLYTSSSSHYIHPHQNEMLRIREPSRKPAPWTSKPTLCTPKTTSFIIWIGLEIE